MKHDYLLCHKQDEEYSQAIARVVILGIITAILCLFYFFGHLTLHALTLSSGYWIFGIMWAAMVRVFPGDYLPRRLTAVVTDLGTLSFALYLIDSVGAALYPLYLWVIVGNGMRFGPRCLIMAMMLGLGGFGTAVSLNDYWAQNIPTAIGLAIGIAVLPLFYLELIKRMHLLSGRLDQQLKKASYAATHDGLTDLANRSYFFQRVTEEIAAAERNQLQFAILFIDLDGFKDINDTYGHQYGDETLITIARRLKTILRKSDVISRLGGDEFGILMHAIQNSEDLRKFSHMLNKTLSEPINIDNEIVQVTASIGISLYPNHGTTPDELIRKADEAMYRTKNKGKNGFTFYLQEVAIS